MAAAEMSTASSSLLRSARSSVKAPWEHAISSALAKGPSPHTSRVLSNLSLSSGLVSKPNGSPAEYCRSHHPRSWSAAPIAVVRVSRLGSTAATRRRTPKGSPRMARAQTLRNVEVRRRRLKTADRRAAGANQHADEWGRGGAPRIEPGTWMPTPASSHPSHRHRLTDQLTRNVPFTVFISRNSITL